MSKYNKGDTIVDERGHAWKVVRTIVLENKEIKHDVEKSNGQGGELTEGKRVTIKI